jgi:hypothetical protein
VRVRTNQQGDTCIDNRAPAGPGAASADGGAAIGPDAPYVTVTEQLGTGVYRVQSGQRVMFEHGSVAAVVDHEKEPCGCPPMATPQNLVADSGAAGAATAGGANADGKAKTPEFPLAQSEGLAPAPPPPTEPAVPAGVPHAQVTIPFAYDGSRPPPAAEAGPAPAAATPATASTTAPATTAPATTAPAGTAAAPPTTSGGDLWSAVKHFFGKMFGKKTPPAKKQ